MKKQLIDLLKEKDIELESQSFKLEQISEIQEELKNVIGSDWNQWPMFKKNFFIEHFAIVIVWADKICELPLTPNYTKKSYYQNFFKLTKNKKLPKMAEQLKIDLWKIGRWIPYFYYVNLVHEVLEKDERYHGQDGSIDIDKKISYLISLLIMVDVKLLVEIIQIVYFQENWVLLKIGIKSYF
ncbi:hypothetical protein R7Y11_01185 [Mesomycoplasma ovipneumoniae]|uniref:hypothetical protein n=1 Tax=Mesomycoplasma ovipneumoniae TaxID=29562 RepID=UPI002964A383|nr:hypothetical protein [Mesomycoplasma ovipneumoniae]MDW2924803.1 hypothetical protein [Mesomycoplasma ovipneumoniae]